MSEITSSNSLSDINPMMQFTQGARLEAKDFTNNWYPVKVVQVDWGDREVLVHFEQWSSRYDEWIKMDSERLRPCTKPIKPKKLKKREFRIGDQVLAPWSDNRKYPAKLIAKYSDGTCKIEFFDGFIKKIRQSVLSEVSSVQVPNADNSKSQSMPSCKSDEVGSKEERRMKKRKLVVAELFYHHKRLKKKVEDQATPCTSSEMSNIVMQEEKAEISESNDLKCLVEECGKEFRNKTLLLMHLKHYHPDFTNDETKSMSVMEMAHLRVGEGEEELKLKPTGKFNSIPENKVLKKVFNDNKLVASNESKFKKKFKLGAKKLISNESGNCLSSTNDEESGDIGDLPLVETNSILTFELESSSDVTYDLKDGILKTTDDGKSIDNSNLPKKIEFELMDGETSSRKRKRLSSSRSSVKNDDRCESSVCDPDDDNSMALSVKSEETEDSIIEQEYDLINCLCGENEEEGLMIQCEWCYTWQHGACHNIIEDADVPDKYICQNCLNPKNERGSRQYSHDQDWLKEGTLHEFNFIENLTDQPSKFLMKKVHHLIGLVLSMKSVIRCLRHKLNLSGDMKHPKLVQWSKPWDSHLQKLTPNISGLLISDKELSSTKSFMTQDHQQISITCPPVSLNNKEASNCSCFSSNSILSNMAETCKIHSRIPDCYPIDHCSVGMPPNDRYSNLNSRIEQWSNLSVNYHNSCNSTSPKPNGYPMRMASKECFEPRCEETAEIPSNRETNDTSEKITELTPHYSGPIPETPIDLKDCQLNLLDHIADVENILDHCLSSVEVQVVELESDLNKCNVLKEVSKMTELMHLLSKDLETVKMMATI